MNISRQAYGFAAIMDALPAAEQARHATLPCTKTQYAIIIGRARSATSRACAVRFADFDPASPVVFDESHDAAGSSSGSESSNNRDHNEIMKKLCEVLPHAHVHVCKAIKALIGLHDRTMWSADDRLGAAQNIILANQDILRDLITLLPFHPLFDLVKKPTGREKLHQSYINMVFEEMHNLSSHLLDTLRNLNRFPAELLAEAEFQGDESSCTFCIWNKNHNDRNHDNDNNNNNYFQGVKNGSWADMWGVILSVIETLKLCNEVIIGGRLAGIKSWEADHDPVTVCAHLVCDLDRLIEQSHPFVHRMQDRLREVPFFATKDEENLKQLLALATEVVKETIDRELDSQGVIANFRMVTAHQDYSYNGFAQGATLLGDLATDIHRYLRVAYNVDPDEIGRLVWF